MISGFWTRHVIAGVVCLGILSGIGVTHAWPLWFGQIVRLEVQPVDPRDPFRGDYVWLTTPSERVPVKPSADVMHRLVYVQLEPVVTRDGIVHRPVGLATAPVHGRINLRGRSRYNSEDDVHVDYGLNAFYMQEGTALLVEQALRSGGRVLMEVAIAGSGRARIRNLIVNGAPLPR